MRVHTRMLHECMHAYPGLGDWRALSASEIRWLYQPLIPGLIRQAQGD